MSKVLSFSVPDDWLDKLSIAFPDTSPNLAGKRAVEGFLKAIDKPSNLDTNTASNLDTDRPSNLDTNIIASNEGIDRPFFDNLAATVAGLDGTVAELYKTVNHQGQQAIDLAGRVEAIEMTLEEMSSPLPSEILTVQISDVAQSDWGQTIETRIEEMTRTLLELQEAASIASPRREPQPDLKSEEGDRAIDDRGVSVGKSQKKLTLADRIALMDAVTPRTVMNLNGFSVAIGYPEKSNSTVREAFNAWRDGKELKGYKRDLMDAILKRFSIERVPSGYVITRLDGVTELPSPPTN
jgi:hypothetical protein